jgi:DNA-nicking Smr family endonuclease
MSRRRLSDDEHVLWKGVTRSIAPLRKIRKDEKQTEIDEAPPAAPRAAAKSRSRAAAPLTAPVAPLKPAAPPPLAPLTRKMKHRIARGRHAIDGRLDLHGMTQAEAHAALVRFLHARQARGSKVVLVITGKGARGDDSGRGVLKRMVPLWLGLPELRALIVGFENAAIGHGGEGALYVSLRKVRGD